MDIRSANRLLALMTEADFGLIADDLERVALERDEVIVEPGEDNFHAYFFESGIASVVSISGDETMTEIGIIGRDGFSGTSAILGNTKSPYRTFMQVGDATAMRMPLTILQTAMHDSATMRNLILQYAQIFYVQTAQSLVSHAHDRLEARLARWLLMCHDRLDGDVVELTHTFMSMMVAAQRTGVTMALHVIEGAGIIRAERRSVRILDRERLEGLAGEAYGVSEAEYCRVIGAFGKSQS